MKEKILDAFKQLGFSLIKTAQRKNLRGKSNKFISLLRNKISNNYGN